MDKEYTRQELENMSAMQLCEIAMDLNIIDADELMEEIWDMRGKEG